jgi:membrane protein YdbS with pleckstrin-like domain
MQGSDATLSIKPVFVGWITLLMQLPFQIFLAVWSGGFFGVIAANLMGGTWAWLPPLLIGGTVFVVMPVAVYTVRKLNYARTEYRFYPDRVEFEAGFFTINKKVVKFRDVKEVTLRKGILQQLYGLGTIYLSTLATGVATPASPFAAFGFGNISASGVSVRDVPKPDDAYETIKKMVDARSE